MEASLRLPAILLASTFVLSAPDAALARFQDGDAKKACKQHGRLNFDAQGYHGLTVSQLKKGKFLVTGVIERARGKDRSFKCVANDGRIASFDVEGRGGGGGGGSSDTDDLLGAALGVALGAAIIGAISSDHKHDDYRAPTGSAPPRHQGRDPFSPAKGITCFPRQQACFSDPTGGVSTAWTPEEFGGF